MDPFERLLSVVLWTLGVVAVLTEPVLLIPIAVVLVVRYVRTGRVI